MVRRSESKIRRTAAVLVPFCRREDGLLRLVLVRRGDSGIHGGQLALPGGKSEPGDKSALGTALREAEEEIGISSNEVNVIEPLSVLVTRTTGYRIYPYLAYVKPPSSWKTAGGEIMEVLELELSELLDPALHDEGMMEFPTWTQPCKTEYIKLGSDRIWGVTYRILKPLLERIASGSLRL